MLKLSEFEISANSLDEARKTKTRKVLDDWIVLTEEIKSSGSNETISVGGTDKEKVLEEARKRGPEGTEIATEKISENSHPETVEEVGQDELEVRARLEPDDGSGLYRKSISKISMKTRGRSGVFGIGRKDPIFSCDLSYKFHAEIIFVRRTVVKYEVARLTSLEDAKSIAIHLFKRTDDYYKKLDNPMPNQVVALMAMGVAFEFLTFNVANPYNDLIAYLKRTVTDGAEINQLKQLNLGAPAKNFDINSIGLVSEQFQSALIEMIKVIKILEVDV